jgi:hypothetical protein
VAKFGKDPIYRNYEYNFLPFDNLYRRAYFVMHTFLVLLAIVLSVLLRYTDSDYPFAIFKLVMSVQMTYYKAMIYKSKYPKIYFFSFFILHIT